MPELTALLEELCLLPGPSGDEGLVRERILQLLQGYADCTVDALGNILARKRGAQRAACKLMVDAHLDEVGLIVTGVTQQGYLRFDTLGGIDPKVLLGRRVTLHGVAGVIGCTPVHLLSGEQRDAVPDVGDMVIDIGAAGKKEALESIALGDTAVFDSPFVRFGDGMLKAKAIDDRAGCAMLIQLLREDAPYDFTATFTVQEETGLVGARTAAYGVNPDAAIVLESTTAADIAGVPHENRVCYVGKGPVLSVMDRHTIYDRDLVRLAQGIARQSELPCQIKQAVAGGNNAGAIHSSRAGVRTLAVSLPCRYLHSAACVIAECDLQYTFNLTKHLIAAMAAGRLA